MPKLPTRVMWATKTSGEVALLDAHTQLRNPPCFLHHHQTQQHPGAPAHSLTCTTAPIPPHRAKSKKRFHRRKPATFLLILIENEL